jgi:hypothetical protein
MDRIKQDNQTLSQLTKQSLRLELPRARRNRRTPDFKGVRDSARSVYAILRSGWMCGCQGSHTANLRLESRTDDDVESDQEEDELAVKQPRFRVVFSNNHGEPVSNRAPWLWEEADIRVLKETQSFSVPVVPIPHKTPMKKGIRFKDQTQIKVSRVTVQQPDLAPIQDLCRAIQKLQERQREVCLGFIVDEITNQRHGIFPLKSPSIDRDTWSAVSLQHLIPPKPTIRRRFTRGDKLRLAVILASSVLQLHQTPWLEETWRKDDIRFIQSADGPLYAQPFIARGFSAETAANRTLLTTSFGMYRVIRNQTLFALGILLIELCLGKPFEELRLPSELNDDGTPHPTSDWITADRLVEDVYLEGGSRYGDAVRRCIRCDFDRRETNLEDENFQQAVYEGVVALLEDDLKEFHRL